MANAKLFKTASTSPKKGLSQVPTTVNDAGASAFSLDDKAALLQYVSTGTFHGTYYATGQEQMDRVLELAGKADSLFIAKAAIYARNSALMKDTPAFLCAILASRKDEESLALLRRVFPKVIGNGRMLRTFVQMVRSGVTGRKSFGSAVKGLIQNYLEKRQIPQLFDDAVGATPSLADIIKMVHPKAGSPERAAFFGYLLGKKVDNALLPCVVQEYEAFKASPDTAKVPEVSFQYLTGLPLSKRVWESIADNAGWHMTRMNLNTFQRQGILDDKSRVNMLAKRLEDPEQIRRNRAMPYQLFAAFKHTEGSGLPGALGVALQRAADVSVDNIPDFGDLEVAVAVDVSSSMNTGVHGSEKGSHTSKVTCAEAASLIASAILRKNPSNTTVLRFDTSATFVDLNPLDSMMTNASKLAFRGGGTDCGSPVQLLTSKGKKVDLIIILSDNESWMGNNHYRTTLQTAFQSYLKSVNPKAKLVCCDLVPNSTSQVPETRNILNIGGINDAMFTVIREFAQGEPASWVKTVDNLEI